MLCCVIQCSSSHPSGGPTVTISPASRDIYPGVLIRLTAQGASRIVYTLDDTRPSPTRGRDFTKPFALWSTSTIQAIAIDSAGRIGPIAHALYQVDTHLPQTVVFPPSGNYGEPVRVEFTTDSDASVLYLQGSKLLSLKQAISYTQPFVVDRDTTIRFFAIDKQGNREPVQSVAYNFPPHIQTDPRAGIWQKESIAISIQTNKPASVDVRTLNGLPNRSFVRYTKPIVLRRDARLVLFAKDAKGASRVVERDYALLRPREERNFPLQKQEIFATASLDVEGFDQPVLFAATKDALLYIRPQKDGWEKPVVAAQLSFQTAWIRSWDLNGDGLSDFLIGDTQGRLHVFQTRSATRVVSEPKLLLPWLPQKDVFFLSAVPMDVDGDGQLDLFLVARDAKKSVLLRRTTQGYKIFDKAVHTFPYGVRAALSGDFNRDRKADLLILPQERRAPYLLFGNGKGTFRTVSFTHILDSIHGTVEWLHAGRTDIDNDGDLDLVLLGRGRIPKHYQSKGPQAGTQGTHLVVLKRIVGQEWKRAFALYLPAHNWRSLVLGDWDQDGFVDIFLPAQQKEHSIWVKNMLGLRLFVIPKSTSSFPWTSYSVGCADFWKSGRMSLAVWQSNGALRTWQSKPSTSVYVRPVLQGIRGNRNAIGSQIFWRAKGVFTRMREIGIRTTGPDQSAFFTPVHFMQAKHVGQLTVYGTDGAILEVPHPKTNETLFVVPH